MLLYDLNCMSKVYYQLETLFKEHNCSFIFSNWALRSHTRNPLKLLQFALVNEANEQDN